MEIFGAKRVTPTAANGRYPNCNGRFAINLRPTPPGSRKLIGSEHTYRIRVGDYRVIYDVQGSNLVIEIIRVGHRKDVYQG